jgi:hypothetical protein
MSGRGLSGCLPLSPEEMNVDQHAFVDSELLERAMRLSDEPRASVVLTKALEEYIARRDPKRLLELIGKLEWDATYDHKHERSRN